MKIYTEVVMEWDDDKGKMVEISSESYEYEGDVALCGKSGEKIGTHRQKEANPYSMASRLPSNRFPQNVQGGPGSGLPYGFADRGIKGIYPSYKAGVGGYPGSSGVGLDMYKYGNKNVNLGETYGYNTSNVKGPNWEEGWYDPYFHSSVSAPIREIIGGDSFSYPGFPSEGKTYGAQKLIRSGEGRSQFMPVSEAIGDKFKPLWEGLGVGSQASAVGYDEPVVAVEGRTATGLNPIMIDELLSEEAYQDELADLETREIKAGEAKKEELTSVKDERRSFIAGRAPEYERARAAQAATGMAYSAPAEEQLTSTQEETTLSLSDMKRKEFKTRKDYDEAIESIESDKITAEKTREGEKAQHLMDVGGVFADTATAAEELYGVGDEILLGHREYGKTLSGGGLADYYGKSTYSKGVGGGGAWTEPMSAESERLKGISEESKQFALDVQSVAQSQAQDIVAGLSDLGV